MRTLLRRGAEIANGEFKNSAERSRRWGGWDSDAERIKDISSNERYNEEEFTQELKVEFPALWGRAFVETFGPKAVLGTHYVFPREFVDSENHKVINLPSNIRGVLMGAKVKRDSDIVPDFIVETIPTLSPSITAARTGTKSASFWMPRKTIFQVTGGGKEIHVRFRDKRGAWHPHYEFPKYRNEDIDCVKVSDNGRG